MSYSIDRIKAFEDYYVFAETCLVSINLHVTVFLKWRIWKLQ